MAYANLLEPWSLVTAFLAHPPAGFQVLGKNPGVPAFAAHFDLLTTADVQTKRRVESLPFYGTWRSLLSPKTCFIGTTVSEYALLPDVPAADLVRTIKDRYARDYALLVIKDLPTGSPLLDAAARHQCAEVEAACVKEGFVLLEGQALAYLPLEFDSVEGYLSQRSSSRRKDIQRKLRAGRDVSVSMVATGSDVFADDSLLSDLYALYLNVFRQSQVHFDQLSAAFFRAVFHDGSSSGRVFLYRLGGRLIGFNLCYVHGRFLIDKYVGFEYPAARDCSVYFRSWIENIRYALAHQLTHYVAGWTDPQIKHDLGAVFHYTRHAVHVRNVLLRAVLRRLAPHFEGDRLWRESRDA